MASAGILKGIVRKGRPQRRAFKSRASPPVGRAQLSREVLRRPACCLCAARLPPATMARAIQGRGRGLRGQRSQRTPRIPYPPLVRELPTTPGVSFWRGHDALRCERAIVFVGSVIVSIQKKGSFILLVEEYVKNMMNKDG